VRLLPLLLAAALLPSPARADELDLSRSRPSGKPPSLVVRAEGGSDFAPYGNVGGAVSWLTESQFEFEAGAGGGFPGLQLGFAARRLFGERGSYFVSEIAIAGNPRVNRGAADADKYLSAGAVSAKGSVWTLVGIGFEQRQDLINLSLVGSIVFTTASFTPHFAVHGGVGIAF
jgi:hypothetical protein